MKLQTAATLGAVALLALLGVVLVRKASSVGATVAGAASAAADAVNPLSDTNIFYTGAGKVADVVGGGDSKPLGVRVWEFLNPAAVAAEQQATAPTPIAAAAQPWESGYPFEGGIKASEQGSWDIGGGAAFGIYPKP